MAFPTLSKRVPTTEENVPLLAGVCNAGETRGQTGRMPGGNGGLRERVMCGILRYSVIFYIKGLCP